MSALKIKDDQGNWINLPGLKGDKGDKGDKGESGVYLGTTAPSDEDINVWINPNGSAHMYGDFIVQGTDGIKRKIIFNQDRTCSWEEVS